MIFCFGLKNKSKVFVMNWLRIANDMADSYLGVIDSNSIGFDSQRINS